MLLGYLVAGHSRKVLDLCLSIVELSIKAVPMKVSQPFCPHPPALVTAAPVFLGGVTLHA